MTVLRGNVVKDVKANQPVVFRALDALSKKYGPETFRVIGQRYFKNQRERAALQLQIAEREKELRKLQEKAQR
jgi:hypothetical protein